MLVQGAPWTLWGDRLLRTTFTTLCHLPSYGFHDIMPSLSSFVYRYFYSRQTHARRGGSLRIFLLFLIINFFILILYSPNSGYRGTRVVGLWPWTTGSATPFTALSAGAGPIALTLQIRIRDSQNALQVPCSRSGKPHCRLRT